jgi:centrosomal protein CEP95
MRGVSGERAKEVRREVLTSLYRRYLKELQATRKPAKKTEPSSAVKARDRSQRRGEQRQPRPGTKHGHKLEDKRECEREAGRERQPPTVGVTSDLFPVVEASLPVCPVATETVRRLWRKQLQQITTFTKRTPSHPHSVDNEISEMERKHTALLEAVKKEIDHTRRLHNQQEARVQQRAVKTELQARRQATARARRYFRDYELNLKSKLQKKRTNEEQVCVCVLKLENRSNLNDCLDTHPSKLSL